MDNASEHVEYCRLRIRSLSASMEQSSKAAKHSALTLSKQTGVLPIMRRSANNLTVDWLLENVNSGATNKLTDLSVDTESSPVNELMSTLPPSSPAVSILKKHQRAVADREREQRAQNRQMMANAAASKQPLSRQVVAVLQQQRGRDKSQLLESQRSRLREVQSQLRKACRVYSLHSVLMDADQKAALHKTMVDLKRQELELLQFRDSLVDADVNALTKPIVRKLDPLDSPRAAGAASSTSQQNTARSTHTEIQWRNGESLTVPQLADLIKQRTTRLKVSHSAPVLPGTHPLGSPKASSSASISSATAMPLSPSRRRLVRVETDVERSLASLPTPMRRAASQAILYQTKPKRRIGADQATPRLAGPERTDSEFDLPEATLEELQPAALYDELRSRVLLR